MTQCLLQKIPAGLHFLLFLTTLQRGGTCAAHGIGAKLSQVGLKIEILASSGCSWAPFGRILVPKSCQHGRQGIPRRLQEWIFGGFSADFNADFTYLYQQVSKYERHWAAAQDTVCRARGPRRKTHYVLHESRGLQGRWACSFGCRL